MSTDQQLKPATHSSCTVKLQITAVDGSAFAYRRFDWIERPAVGDDLYFGDLDYRIRSVVLDAEDGELSAWLDDDTSEERLAEALEYWRDELGFEVVEATAEFRSSEQRHFDQVERLEVKAELPRLFWCFDDIEGVFIRVEDPVRVPAEKPVPKHLDVSDIAKSVPLEWQQRLVRRHMHQLRIEGRLNELMPDSNHLCMQVRVDLVKPNGDHKYSFNIRLARVPNIGETVMLSSTPCRVTNVCLTEPEYGLVARVIAVDLDDLIKEGA